MTHKDIYTKFMIEYDKANVTSSYPSLTQYEVATLLDKAYLALIARKFTGNNPRQSAFETDIKSISDLQPLVVRENVSLNLNGPAKNVSSFNISDLHNDYLYYVQTYLKYTMQGEPMDGYKERIVPTRLIPHDMATKFFITPYNMPWVKNPVCYEEDNKVFVVYDSVKSPSNDALFVYIRKPAPFVLGIPNAPVYEDEEEHNEPITPVDPNQGGGSNEQQDNIILSIYLYNTNEESNIQQVKVNVIGSSTTSWNVYIIDNDGSKLVGRDKIYNGTLYFTLNKKSTPYQVKAVASKGGVDNYEIESNSVIIPAYTNGSTLEPSTNNWVYSGANVVYLASEAAYTVSMYYTRGNESIYGVSYTATSEYDTEGDTVIEPTTYELIENNGGIKIKPAKLSNGSSSYPITITSRCSEDPSVQGTHTLNATAIIEMLNGGLTEGQTEDGHTISQDDPNLLEYIIDYNDLQGIMDSFPIPPNSGPLLVDRRDGEISDVTLGYSDTTDGGTNNNIPSVLFSIQPKQIVGPNGIFKIIYAVEGIPNGDGVFLHKNEYGPGESVFGEYYLWMRTWSGMTIYLEDSNYELYDITFYGFLTLNTVNTVEKMWYATTPGTRKFKGEVGYGVGRINKIRIRYRPNTSNDDFQWTFQDSYIMANGYVGGTFVKNYLQSSATNLSIVPTSSEYGTDGSSFVDISYEQETDSYKISFVEEYDSEHSDDVVSIRMFCKEDPNVSGIARFSLEYLATKLNVVLPVGELIDWYDPEGQLYYNESTRTLNYVWVDRNNVNNTCESLYFIQDETCPVTVDGNKLNDHLKQGRSIDRVYVTAICKEDSSKSALLTIRNITGTYELPADAGTIENHKYTLSYAEVIDGSEDMYGVTHPDRLITYDYVRMYPKMLLTDGITSYAYMLQVLRDGIWTNYTFGRSHAMYYTQVIVPKENTPLQIRCILCEEITGAGLGNVQDAEINNVYSVTYPVTIPALSTNSN